MKAILITLCVFITVCSFMECDAQAELGNKEKMKLFQHWAGRWQGEGFMQMGPGEPKRSSVDETIEYKLDSMVMLVEGVGKAEDTASKKEIIVHHALAVVSYDQATNQFKFRTYLKDGRSTDAWLNPIGENKFQWGFEVPGRGKTRYTILLDPAARIWNEIGEFSSGDNNWYKFFEMNLKKVE